MEALRYAIGSVSVTYNNVNLGYTGEDTEVEVQTDLVDITVDKYGGTPVDKVINARRVRVTATLKQLTSQDIQDVWSSVFKEKGAGSNNNRINIGDETNDSLRANAATLVLHPRNKLSAITDDFIVWKAVVVERSPWQLTNNDQRMMTVTWEGLIDETKGLATYGDSNA